MKLEFKPEDFGFETSDPMGLEDPETGLCRQAARQANARLREMLDQAPQVYLRRNGHWYAFSRGSAPGSSPKQKYLGRAAYYVQRAKLVDIENLK